MTASNQRNLDWAVEQLYTGLFPRLYDPLMWLVDKVAAHEAWRDLLGRVQSRLTVESDVLDAACGTGSNLERLLRRNIQIGSYLGVDRSEDMLKIAKRRFGKYPFAAFQAEDLRDLDLGRTFDVIICSWVLSHMDDPQSLILTLKKHLRDGGTLLLMNLQQPDANPGLAPTIYSLVLRRLFHALPLRRGLVENAPNVGYHKAYFGGLVAVTEIEKGSPDAAAE